VLRVYDGRFFRKQFIARRVLRAAYALAGHNLLLEACCAALRTPFGRSMARHIFFARGSFPDVAQLAAPKPRALAMREK
jgi:hypothetical protein